MKKYLTGFFYSLPVQLVFLHFRRYQVLLLFWIILFATISGHFLKPYGADSLMLAPEYLGHVSALSAAFAGFAAGAYIMSWNITTFILHSRHIKFLATTAQPFLKYCINNAVIPLIFLLCYLSFAINYQRQEELASPLRMLSLAGGFLGGFGFAVFIALIVLVLIGLFAENRFFQIPAAASITLFFTILIAVAGALSLFLRTWSIPVVLIVYLFVNWLFINHIIDPRNKAYGLNYNNTKEQPIYDKNNLSQLMNKADVTKDSVAFITILNNWKARQKEEKPVMFILDVSGGGNRSAAFNMNILTRLDTITKSKFFSNCFLICGASGGMMGAAYFRELYLQKKLGKISSLQHQQYIDNISKDLLNPVFTSLVAR